MQRQTQSQTYIFNRQLCEELELDVFVSITYLVFPLLSFSQAILLPFLYCHTTKQVYFMTSILMFI